jgi:predicted small lipoprotein YifL
MKTARHAVLLLTLLLVFATAGCGNKGDLVRPGPRPAAAAGD